MEFKSDGILTTDIRILRLESKAQRLNSPRWDVGSKFSSLMVLEGEGQYEKTGEI